MLPRVLIVDDAAFMRHLVKRCLTQSGFEVVGEAADGGAAAEMYQALKPELVTMDMVMPDVDGLEGIRRIRAFDPKARIVIVSAVDQRENLMEAIRLGAADYIVKPFDAERVAAAAYRALGIERPAASAT